ncbi:hypothetical protein C2845_PM15G00540 [Panicum miliaceum]|uniref:rRNA N-glycosylase n=1 Tax=Panicum miliaceum TaxID=4540 RepID=A0A3L6Q948_PANMI|nr:hypothetical protein C2845_PM15G00540 [Panicum miliaceum]
MVCSSISMALRPILIPALAAGSTNYSPAVAAQRDPPKLLILKLAGRDGDKASLAVQAHDLSLAGYRDLVGGLANLPTLPLGRDPALRAVHALSGHDPAAADGDEVEALKRGLATLTVTKCEALRLTPIKETVSRGWESGDAHLTPEHLGYIEHWDTMCFELIRANRTGEWSGPFTELLRTRANIHSEEDALAVVGVIINRTFKQLLIAHARSA